MRLCAPNLPFDRKAFTVIELCMGLVITSLVLGALAAFTLAMAQHWKHSEQGSTTSVRSRQASNTLNRLVKDARLIGAVRPGSTVDPEAPAAAAIFWISDSNHDGEIQGPECAMIEYDAEQKLLKLYPAGQGDAEATICWSLFTDQAVLDNFKVGRTSHPIARGVEAAQFNALGVLSTTQNPALEYTLELTSQTTGAADGDVPAVEYGTCTVRAPARQPS